MNKTKMNNPEFLIIDLFCGFGGTTRGFEMADNGIAKVIACVNHDSKAIKSHWLNYPKIKHFEEDIRLLNLDPLVSLLNKYRLLYPNAKVILWASLECTNFSKAKGGLPRSADSRTLAEHLFRYEKALNPDYIQIENVVEFMSWGPLDANGKPLSRKNGKDWLKWRNDMCSRGYNDEWREMNSADFGAYTSRNRLFGCFAKDGLPIVWPVPTHSKKGSKGMFHTLNKWMPVKEVLNFEDEGRSIFGRKKPLSDKTLLRIYSGLIKYIANGETTLLNLPGAQNLAINKIQIETEEIRPSNSTASSIQNKFLLKYNSINGKTGVHHPPSVDEPSPVISCQNRLGILQTSFLQHYYGNGFITSINQPCPTITTKERAAIIQPEYFINRDFNTVTNSSIEQPAGAITTIPKLNLIKVNKFLINPQFSNTGNSIEKPCFTLIAKMDKRPPSLVHVDKGDFYIQINKEDSSIAIKIKIFMVIYGLIDIKMRMLRVAELLKIQGFPENYKMSGTQADYKKFIGNSVVPQIVKAWIESFSSKLKKINKAA